MIAPFNHVNTDFYQNPLCGKSEGFANHRQQGRFRHWTRSSNRRKPKIIDGQISKPNSWPWQVSVSKYYTSLIFSGESRGQIFQSLFIFKGHFVFLILTKIGRNFFAPLG